MLRLLNSNNTENAKWKLLHVPKIMLSVLRPGGRNGLTKNFMREVKYDSSGFL